MTHRTKSNIDDRQCVCVWGGVLFLSEDQMDDNEEKLLSLINIELADETLTS